MMIGEDAALAITAPALQVTVYVEIGLPPSLAGGTKSKMPRPSRGVTTGAVGTPGTVRGVTLTLDDAALKPAALRARTLHE